MLNPVYRAKDRIILVVILVHSIGLGFFSLTTNNLQLNIPGVFAVGVSLGVYWWKPGSLLSRSVLAVCLLMFSGLLIHLSHGLIEMHFHIFAALALLSIYYDWRVIALAGFSVCLHHLYGLIAPDYQVYALNPDLWVYLLFVVFVVLTCITLGYQSWVINRSVNTINLSSRTLIEHDLPQLMTYLKEVSNGRLQGEVELKARPVPVVALDELGSLSRLYNLLVQSCQSIGQTSMLLGQSMESMLARSKENIEHIRKLSNRMARSTGDSGTFIVPSVSLSRFKDEANYNLRDQIEVVSMQMVLAAMHLDELQHRLETKIGEQEQLNLRLEDINQLKGRFFASLSHELRTPLTSILGYSELLTSTAGHNLSAGQLKWVKQISQSALDMRQLINDILDFSKMEAGKLNIFLEKTVLAEVFDKATEAVRVLAEQKNLTVTQQVPAELVALADVARLNQVLLNLLSNSIKFTPANGRVELSGFAVRLDATAEAQAGQGLALLQSGLFPALEIRSGNWVGIQITDSGIGIEAEKLSFIFEEFEQIEDSARPGISGSGLGLAVVKKLTSLMGGQVAVKSVKGQGSTFVVLLPAWTPTARPDSSPGSLLDTYVYTG